MRHFVTVNGTSPYFKAIESAFLTTIAPIYGDQSKALEQIFYSNDRTCELLLDGNKPVGVLLYKNIPNSEFSDFTVSNSLEIKSLFVIEPHKNSGKGYGSNLVNRALEIGLDTQANTMHLTVSAQKQQALDFFLKKGFVIQHSWFERYQPNTTEYLLTHALPKLKLHLQAPYFDLIKSGQKTVEGRLNKDKYQNIHPGDKILFIDTLSPTRKMTCEVNQIQQFKNFTSMLNTVGLEKCLPNTDNIEDGAEIYRAFPGYREQVKSQGAVALSFNLPRGC